MRDRIGQETKVGDIILINGNNQGSSPMYLAIFAGQTGVNQKRYIKLSKYKPRAQTTSAPFVKITRDMVDVYEPDYVQGDWDEDYDNAISFMQHKEYRDEYNGQ